MVKQHYIVVFTGIAFAGLLAACVDWPNLDTVTGPYPNGSCTLDGSAAPNSPKAFSNRLKNRYKLPDKFTPITWAEMEKLPLGELADQNNLGVAFTGYVKDVHVGGTNGESCNCRTKEKSLLDIHIDIVRDPMNPKHMDRAVIAEVTHRGRILAERGLLKSNVGKDWSERTLRDKLLGRWVRFSGWLFYDPDHLTGGFVEDPEDKGASGRNESPNWRLSGWEIHPVMGIEVLSGKPSGTF